MKKLLLILAASTCFAQVARVQRTVYFTPAGTGDAITGTPSPALSAYTDLSTPVPPVDVCFIAGAVNTTGVTLSLNGLTAKSIYKMAGAINTALAAGDIRAKQKVCVMYNATDDNFQMMTQTGGAIGDAVAGASALLTAKAVVIVGASAGSATQDATNFYWETGVGLNLGVTHGVKLKTLGSPFTLSSGASTFNAVRDDLGRWAYNLNPATAGKVDSGEPMYDMTMEAHYYDLTSHFFEYNWNWLSADGMVTRRPFYQVINRATNGVFQQFSTGTFNIYEEAGVVPVVLVDATAGTHNLSFRGGASQSGDLFSISDYGAVNKHFSVGQAGQIITLGNPGAGGGNVGVTTNQVATSNTTHKPSPALNLIGSIWDGSAANAWKVGFAAVGVSGTNGAYLLRISSDYFSSMLDIRADNANANFAGMIQLNGTTSSFPALKRASADIQAKLADDSGFTYFYGKYKSSDGTAGATGATCSAWKDGLCTAN